MSFNQGTTEEKIFGGMDVKRFTDTGEIIYLLEKAFISYEYVILEELFDAYPQVVAAIKDTLTSGYVRNGSQMVPIKTKMIVACTNRDRDEVISDLSIEALLQRFPFEEKVEWADHSKNKYINAFKYQKCWNSDTEVVVEIIDEVNKQVGKTMKYHISPRTAVKAARAVISNNGDIDCLSYFYGFKQAVSKFKAVVRQRKLDAEKLEEYKNYIKEFFIVVESLNQSTAEGNPQQLKDNVLKLVQYKDKMPKSNDATSELARQIVILITALITYVTRNPNSKVNVNQELLKHFFESNSINDCVDIIKRWVQPKP